MLKCQDVDKFDFKFVKKMKPDTVYKLKGKGAIAYTDSENRKYIAYSYTKDSMYPEYMRYSNIFQCLYAIYGTHLWITCEESMRPFNVNHVINDERTADELLKPIIKQIKNLYPRDIELGVELELEPEYSSDMCYDEYGDEFRSKIMDIDDTHLVEAVKSDCSVYGESELNLTHLPLSKWRTSGVKELLRKIREVIGLDNRYGTAGMHIHVSGRKAVNVARQFDAQRKEIGEFLNLIGFRRENIEIPDCDPNHDEHGCSCYRYGTNNDAIKNQIMSHGTCEFRCFEVTTDYDLFMLRLEFIRELFLYLGTGRKIKDFAKTANKRARELFMRLYNDSRNPHAFGVLDETELKLMEA